MPRQAAGHFVLAAVDFIFGDPEWPVSWLSTKYFHGENHITAKITSPQKSHRRKKIRHGVKGRPARAGFRSSAFTRKSNTAQKRGSPRASRIPLIDLIGRSHHFL
jgi:hypothetical protein